MDFLHGETVVRQRGVPFLDPYSNEQTGIDWSDPATATFEHCAVWQDSSVEPTQDARTAVITITSVAFTAGADVLAGDRLLIRGGTYEVQGDPFDWRSPFSGWEPGLVARAQRVEG